jgi:hypothetical protein
MPYSETM